MKFKTKHAYYYSNSGEASITITEPENFLESDAYAYYIVNRAIDFKAELVNADIALLADQTANGRDATLTSPVTIGPDDVLIDVAASNQRVQAIDCKSGHSLMMPFDGSEFVGSSFEIWLGLTLADGQPAATQTLFGGRSGAVANGLVSWITSAGLWTVEYRDDVTGLKLAQSASAAFANGAIAYTVLRVVFDWTEKQISLYKDGVLLSLHATNNGDLSAFDPADYNVTDNWLLGNANNSGALNDTNTSNRRISQFAIVPRLLTADEATDALALFRYENVFLPLSYLSFTTDTELNTARTAAQQFVFGSGGLPTDIPSVWSAFTTDTYVDLTGFTNLDHAEQCIFSLHPTKDWDVKLYQFFPTTANGKCFVLPSGHGDLWTEINAAYNLGGDYETALKYLVDAGYRVIFFYMVGRGPNLTDDGVTQGGSTTHDGMVDLESADPYFNPLQYFLTAAVVSVNYFADEGFSNINMSGISGGGWTTVWMSFLDTRVKGAFPVAGFYPNFVMEMLEASSFDYEQAYKSPTDVERSSAMQHDQITAFNKLSMIIGGAHNRIYREFHNQQDGCCFSGDYASIYEETIKHVLTQIGGTYNYTNYVSIGNHLYTTAILDIIDSEAV